PGNTSAKKAPEYVRRFSPWARLQHLAVLVLFAALLVSGMPQKWPYLDASRWIIEHLGGIFAVRWLHRMSGLAFAALTLAHLATVVGGLMVRRIKPTMLLTTKDFGDA